MSNIDSESEVGRIVRVIVREGEEEWGGKSEEGKEMRTARKGG